MSNWNIYLLNSDSITYDADGTVPRSNQDLQTDKISTQQKIKLANGANAFITPSTKYVKEPITFFWADTTSALRTKIETYINNGDTVKIETHTGETFIGRFISMQRVWFVGIEPDQYDLSVVMERTS